MKFYNLHVHSHYSVLDGLTTIDELIKIAKKRKLKAIALTEHGTLSCAYQLWLKCKENNIKPIIGIEAYYVDDIRKDEGKVTYTYSHILLLCKNEIGWNNLKRLQELAWTEGFYAKPRIDFNMLKEYHEGLICSTACVGGLIGRVMFGNDKYFSELKQEEKYEIVKKRLKKFKKLFGKDFYLEIMFNKLKEQIKLNKLLIKLSDKYNIPIIITNDVHFIDKSHKTLHDIIKCVQFKKSLNDEDNGTYDISNIYFVNLKHIKKFKDRWNPEISDEQLLFYVKNCKKIINNIEEFPIRTKESALPKFSKNSKKMLLKLCKEGMKKYKLDGEKEYENRLKEELIVINKLGMADYFLIVWDIAREARKRNIPFNTRGSVAGSLVAYLIGISWIDPIKFDTPFERFLTEDRLSLPDIDMDFGKQRRYELIDYLREKYGDDNVAHIVNFSIFKPKSGLKDVSRVYDVSFNKINEITKTIPDGISKWEELEEQNLITGKLKKYLEEYPEIEEYTKSLIKRIRHKGVHASGVVLTPDKIIKWTPIAYSTVEDKSKKEKVTEFDMYDLEDLNILKLDFLGQNTLDIIQYTLKLIGKKNLSNFDELYKTILNDLNNKDVYKYICTGQLVGMFQLGTSSGMHDLVVALKPQNIDDIIACVSLYRSAILAIGAHTKFINRRFGKEEIEYLHPKLIPVLQNTYGIFLYQEQIMMTARVLAGFTASEADNFRKAIKQKDEEKFLKWQEKFIKGCKKESDINEKLAKKIWDELEKWSGYGFNKCLTGDTNIYLEYNGKYSWITIEELVNEYLYKDINYHYVKILAYNGKSIGYRPIKQIYCNGVKTIYEVKLKNGMFIKATDNHRLLTDKGYKQIKELRVGDILIIMGEKCNIDKRCFKTGKSKIISIIKLKEKKVTYDIEMDTKEHNFIANGIVSHNSHATSYGLIAYITAWLKYHYPIEFMISLLTYNAYDDDKLKQYMSEAKRMGIEFLLPEINIAEKEFKLYKNKIMYPLTVIKGLGEKALDNIIETRKRKGKYTSFIDFLNKINLSKVNVKIIEHLIFANCFRNFGKAEILLQELFNYRNKDKKTISEIRLLYCKECKFNYPVSYTKKQVETKSIVCPACGGNKLITKYDKIKDKPINMRYCRKIIFGFNVVDPLKPYTKILLQYDAIKVSDVNKNIGEVLCVAGVIENIKKHIDKNGNEMAFIRYGDDSNTVDMVVFASDWNYFKSNAVKNDIYILSCYIQDDDKLIFKKFIKKLNL